MTILGFFDFSISNRRKKPIFFTDSRIQSFLLIFNCEIMKTMQTFHPIWMLNIAQAT